LNNSIGYFPIIGKYFTKALTAEKSLLTIISRHASNSRRNN